MKKLILTIFCAFLVIGCGSSSDTETKTVDKLSKTIANKYAVVTVPDAWTVLKTPSSTPQLILMEKFPMTAGIINSENFGNGTTKKLFELAQNDFPTAELLEEISEKKLKFAARKNNDGDEYIFEQKIIELKNDEYLLANCSYPYDYPANECADFFDAISLR